jgi:uridylate kinase
VRSPSASEIVVQPVPYKRIVLKLSGEVLGGESRTGLDIDFIGGVLDQIRQVVDLGIEIGIVVGGGNILRGSQAVERGLGRVSADYIGMLSTVINGIAIRDIGASRSMDVRVMNSLAGWNFIESYAVEKALDHLHRGRVVVFVGGTGNPFLTTDTAAALRAAEIDADVLLKATKVDGVYSTDPEIDSNAERFERISFGDAMRMGLEFMDQSALCICSQVGIPVIVFNIYEKESIKRVALREKIGTVVEGVSND